MQKQTRVDFRTVKNTVTMDMVLDHYGVNWLRKKGDEVSGKCPIHKGEGPDTFHASLSKNAFQCFSCKARGNVLDFVAAMEMCTVKQAAEKLATWFAVSHAERTEAGEHPKNKPAPVEDVKSTVNAPLTFQLKGINHEHPYLAQRGIDGKLAAEFGIGHYPGKGSMSGRIVIPIHNELGELVAYAGRSIDDSEPKYKLPAGFHKSQVVYNLHRAIERKTDTMVVVEGFFGCVHVWRAGFTSVALIGSTLSGEQERLICDHFTGAVLLFDGDEAGKRCTDECLRRLGRKLWVKAIALTDGQQPDTLSEKELQQLLE